MSIISDNIAALTAYPLVASGSVDNINIQKLRAFSAPTQPIKSFVFNLFESTLQTVVVRGPSRIFVSAQIP